ncbi:MAG TPA: DNA helicase, partial [Deltaproteobacteria bacterium]|nr:DNA helicase [Deltaproteobacteria bacterium]
MHSCFLDGYMGSFRFLMEGNYKPIIVQSDGSILLEVMSEAYEDARDAILPFTELVKSPEYVHTYRITALSIWNAAATGMTFDEVMTRLGSFSRYEIPKSVISRIREAFSRWGSVSLSRADKSNIIVEVRDERILEEILSNRKLGPVVKEILSPKSFIIPSDERGRFKHLLIKMGYPAED